MDEFVSKLKKEVLLHCKREYLKRKLESSSYTLYTRTYEIQKASQLSGYLEFGLLWSHRYLLANIEWWQSKLAWNTIAHGVRNKKSVFPWKELRQRQSIFRRIKKKTLKKSQISDNESFSLMMKLTFLPFSRQFKHSSECNGF